jgi:F0F1-type ATP synthase assembly protein I
VASPFRIVVWQLVATLAVSAVLFLWEYPGGDRTAPLMGVPHTVSALAAGMACVVPAGLYAWRASVERSATRFLLQGVLKFVLTLVLVAAFIVVLKPAAAGFFGTFVLLQTMYVIVPLLEKAGQPRG